MASVEAVDDKAANGPLTQRRLGNVLPQHWTPADSNGARRWGLSFGAGVVLFVVVGAFGAYMTIAEYDDSAWNRASVQHTHASLAGASEAFARRDAPATSTTALVASLEAQMANAYAEAAADADRLHVDPSQQRRAKERHRPVPAQQMEPAKQVGRSTETSAMRTLRSPPAVSRPSMRAAPAQATHAPQAASVAGKSVATRSPPPDSARPVPSPAAAIHPAEEPTKPAAAALDSAAQRNVDPPPVSDDAAHRPLLRAAPAAVAPSQPDATSLSPMPAPSLQNNVDARPTRPSPAAESRERGATPPCGSEEGASDCARSNSAGPATAAPRAQRDTTSNPSASTERTAPPAPAPAPAAQQPARPPAPSLYRGASIVIKRRPSLSTAQSASPNHRTGHVRRRVASSGQPGTQRSDAARRPSPIALTLPRVFSALWPPAFSPAFSPPFQKPLPTIDLSDNQRTLYRGH